MRLYLDASVLVALFTDDALTQRAEAFFTTQRDVALVLSDFAMAEFASAIGLRVRRHVLGLQDARSLFDVIDGWARAAAHQVKTQPSDVADAQGFLRRLDLTLRTPDALNIALCRHATATLVTFDTKMAACAEKLGLSIALA